MAVDPILREAGNSHLPTEQLRIIGTHLQQGELCCKCCTTITCTSTLRTLNIRIQRSQLLPNCKEAPDWFLTLSLANQRPSHVEPMYMFFCMLCSGQFSLAGLSSTLNLHQNGRVSCQFPILVNLTGELVFLHPLSQQWRRRLSGNESTLPIFIVQLFVVANSLLKLLVFVANLSFGHVQDLCIHTTE